MTSRLLFTARMGINVYDVRTGIDSLKGEGITHVILWPGADVCRHFLTKDTYHLERGIQIAGKIPLNFPVDVDSLYVTARNVNYFMPKHMYNLINVALEHVGNKIDDSKIAILGSGFSPMTHMMPEMHHPNPTGI